MVDWADADMLMAITVARILILFIIAFEATKLANSAIENRKFLVKSLSARRGYLR